MLGRLVIGAAVVVCAAGAGSSPADVTLVAPTDKLTPEQERATFKLPPGFVAQLVAAEPDIAKPMNVAFDAKGRLWVTDTVEYPWPVTDGRPGRDSVKVLSDFAADGRARKVETFAAGLNIPLGVLPVGDGAIVYSIPEVRRHRDTDGDGKADKVEPLLGPFGTVDTHGMTNNFVRGFDGWVYANHGFRNDSTVKGVDGQAITMSSGNTYRFRPDGTRPELFARGQVNPFGLAFDERGDLFSADCHTRPQYMLLRGAVYPSFGKPDDGLGFGPEMCPHDHGSTGIAGTMVYAADQFPAEYRGNLFNGNPVTNTINRDRIEWTGSTPRAVDAGDFLASSDPWFRPVQVVLGPDGAIYVADFYNKIIGHYEVDLKHPGRDRTSGRIWRIVYKGDAAEPPPPRMPDLTTADPARLADYLGDPNLAVRMAATHEIADGGSRLAHLNMIRMVTVPDGTARSVHALWALERRGGSAPDVLAEAAKSRLPLTRTHAMRVLAERADWTVGEQRLAQAGLADADPFVARAAADAVARHPHPDHVRPLLRARAKAPAGDTHLVHAIRIALRAQLAGTDVLARLGQEFRLGDEPLSGPDRLVLLDAALGAQSPAAGAFAARCVAEAELPRDVATRALRHAVKLAADERTVNHIAEAASKRFADDVELQLDLLKSVRAALAARGGGGAVPSAVRAWALGVATAVLDAAVTDGGGTTAAPAAVWNGSPIDAAGATYDDPWTTQSRTCADGTSADFWSSLPRGERLTGVLRSRAFAAPPRLSLWVAGHNGPPPNPDPAKNVVRLKDAATGEVLAEARPPRNDTAQHVAWDLARHAGRNVYVEATDGDARAAYAWLAFGRFEPAVVSVPPAGTDPRKRLVAAVELAGAMRLAELAGPVRRLLADRQAEPKLRSACAAAAAAVDPAAAVPPLAAVLADADAPADLRGACAAALGAVRDSSAAPALLSAVAVAPQHVQRAIGLALVGTRDGGEALLAAVAAGKASPRLLADQTVRDKLRAAGIDKIDDRLAALTKGMPDADAAVQALVDARRRAYAAGRADASADRGRAVFLKNCAACHAAGGEGGLVGPQLDGAGKRGADRLVEDILDPSRNVDGAFRYSVLTLDDGDVVTGLQRRVEGESAVLADAQGKEFAVPTARIKKRAESQLSLMPANLGDLIPEREFNDLLAFLMSK